MYARAAIPSGLHELVWPAETIACMLTFPLLLNATKGAVDPQSTESTVGTKYPVACFRELVVFQLGFQVQGWTSVANRPSGEPPLSLCPHSAQSVVCAVLFLPPLDVLGH